MAKLVGSARIIRILIVMFAGCLSFKLSEPPSGTETQGAPGRVEGEGPEDASGAEGDGLGGLGKNLNFLLVKVAQLEALAEMQQAEIATHRLKIASLEKERHSGSDGILLETQSEEEAKTRLEETTVVLKNVWRKHEHQRRTGHFKGSVPMRSGPEALRERGLKNETAGLAAESEENAIIPFIPGGRRRVVPVPSWASDPVGTLEDGFAAASSTVDKVNYAKDQLATHAFDTVEKATTLLENVLGLPGFSDFWVKLHRPEAPSFDLSGKLKLGKIKIEINLISANKHWELDLGTIDLPGSLKAVVSTSLSTVQGAMSLGGELLSCSNWHLPGEAVKCIGNKIVDLFAQLKKVASTALATVEGAMSLGQELQSCSNWHLPGEAVKCFAGKTIEKVEELNFPGDSAVQQVQKMITVGRDLNCANWHVNGGLVTCLGTKIIDKPSGRSALRVPGGLREDGGLGGQAGPEGQQLLDPGGGPLEVPGHRSPSRGAPLSSKPCDHEAYPEAAGEALDTADEGRPTERWHLLHSARRGVQLSVQADHPVPRLRKGHQLLPGLCPKKPAASGPGERIRLAGHRPERLCATGALGRALRHRLDEGTRKQVTRLLLLHGRAEHRAVRDSVLRCERAACLCLGGRGAD
eukprot:s6025_g6.t1